LLTDAIKSIMKPKYNKYKVYLHNLSFFDGVFLLKILAQLTDSKIKPIIRDGRFIVLKLTFNYDLRTQEQKVNKLSLYFRDSFLLLPSSITKLAHNFKVESGGKGIFPYKFVNN